MGMFLNPGSILSIFIASTLGFSPENAARFKPAAQQMRAGARP